MKSRPFAPSRALCLRSHAKVGVSERAVFRSKLRRRSFLRHTFAVNALARMDEAGADIYVALPLLSRYMGHCGPKETELYLRLTDEGRARVLGAMEAYAPGIAPQIGGVADG